MDLVAQEKTGNHVRARWGAESSSAGANAACGLLLLCHMDTVWDMGTVAERPVRVQDGTLYGAGAFDMKGGIVNALWAIRCLRALALDALAAHHAADHDDEETGSRTSRSLIEAEAQKHEAVFVLEPAHPPSGALKTWRKGVGLYKVRVTGIAAHAGAAHDEGVNAIEELAHQVLAIQKLTDYAAGTTVNVGVIGGGTRSNVVPRARVGPGRRPRDEPGGGGAARCVAAQRCSRSCRERRWR